MVEMATRETVTSIFRRFSNLVEAHAKVACLFVFNEPKYYEGASGTAHEAFSYLARQMEPLSNVPAEDLAKGAALSSSITAPCPVTGVPTVYDDFECIAFCPQSNNTDDPLYDPMMHAPYTCVNMSSDLFAFAHFVRDVSLLLFNEEVYRLQDRSKVEDVFAAALERFHKMALSTIRNFEKATDVSKCPMHVAKDERTWVASHQDPAFAETKKEPFVHELPIIYGPRLIERWRAHFAGDTEFTPSGVSQAGVRL